MTSNVKYLNRLCLALILLIFTGGAKIHAQQMLGIYLSAADFNKGKLSFPKEKKKKCKVKLHDFSYKPFITVKYCDSIYTLQKDSIFGYKESLGTNYRFYNKKKYPVLNQGESILLYRTETKSGNPKSPDINVHYYFSKDASSPILPLTERNLESCFNENKVFAEFIEIHFKNDEELAEYDYLNKMYKINRLLQLSLKPKND